MSRTLKGFLQGILGATEASQPARTGTRSRRTFKEDLLQKHFEEHGYAKVSLLDSAVIDELTKHYLGLTGGNVANSSYGMYVSMHDNHDMSVKRETMDTFRRLVFPLLAAHLEDYKLNVGTFLVKVPDTTSHTYPHQDWHYVDHEQFEPDSSIMVWITLKDVDRHGGSLGFVPGSHRFLHNLIGSPAREFRTLTQGHGALFFRYMTFPQVKAGDALIFHNKSIHGALPNTSQQQRIAVSLGLTPSEAQLYHYYAKPGVADRLLKLKVADEFFVEYSAHKLYDLYQRRQVPTQYCEVKDEVSFECAPISSDEMKALCHRQGLSDNGLTVKL
jgi:ectoine hydroxylase-related dioxygenase (phytanoyl-CoA dioxygenase family)